MKIARTISVLIFLFVTFNVANGQYRTVPKKMKVKEDYIHSPTTMTFPLVLFDNYWRKSVYSFDKQNQNIGVTYEKNFNGEVTTFTLYLYPAGEGTEGRLREEYSYAIESASYAMKQEGLRVEQRAVKHEGEKYICKGIRAIFNNDNNDLSQITLFESGVWFYKIRITTNQKDKIFLLNLEREIIKKYDPTILTELNPLVDFYKMYFSDVVFLDSILEVLQWEVLIVSMIGLWIV